MNSQICRGFVRHRRFVGKQHGFVYPLFMMHLDLDALDYVFKDYWFWSVARFNLVSFKSDHYFKNGQKGPLLVRVKQMIAEKTGDTVDKVFLLGNLACLGYCFNPICIYFCFTKDQLTHCIVEVTNTPWGKMHRYLLIPKAYNRNRYHMRFQKALHVSPFLEMNYTYDMRCKYGPDSIVVHIENRRDSKKHFDATLVLKCLPITHQNLARTLLRFPFMTGKVIAGIYWQALRLWLKGVKFINYPTQL